MSEQVKEATEGAKATTGIDLNQYVPKSDHDRSTKEVESLKRTLNDAQEKLLDESYLEFLEQKNLGKKAVLPDSVRQALPPEMQQLAQRLDQTERTQAQILAVLELQQCKEEHTDFKDYQGEIETIIKANHNYSFEQAYTLAKAAKTLEEPSNRPTKEPPRGGEKPQGALPGTEHQSKDYKDASKAGEAAFDEVAQRHGIKGDII